MDGEYEVSAISFHAYAYLADSTLFFVGGAWGNYGPLWCRLNPTPGSPGSEKDSDSGTLTTAFLALRLFSPDITYEVVPFDKILDELA